jgi:hypothetical protein
LSQKLYYDIPKLTVKIADKLTVYLNISAFHDGYKERIEAMIKSKMKGEVAQAEEKKPKKPVAKSMMEAQKIPRKPSVKQRVLPISPGLQCVDMMPIRIVQSPGLSLPQLIPNCLLE